MYVILAIPAEAGDLQVQNWPGLQRTTQKTLCLSFLSLPGALYTPLCAFENISFQIVAKAGGTLGRTSGKSGGSWLQAGVEPSLPPSSTLIAKMSPWGW